VQHLHRVRQDHPHARTQGATCIWKLGCRPPAACATTMLHVYHRLQRRTCRGLQLPQVVSALLLRCSLGFFRVLSTRGSWLRNRVMLLATQGTILPGVLRWVVLQPARRHF